MARFTAELGRLRDPFLEVLLLCCRLTVVEIILGRVSIYLRNKRFSAKGTINRTLLLKRIPVVVLMDWELFLVGAQDISSDKRSFLER